MGGGSGVLVEAGTGSGGIALGKLGGSVAMAGMLGGSGGPDDSDEEDGHKAGNRENGHESVSCMFRNQHTANSMTASGLASKT